MLQNVRDTRCDLTPLSWGWGGFTCRWADDGIKKLPTLGSLVFGKKKLLFMIAGWIRLIRWTFKPSRSDIYTSVFMLIQVFCWEAGTMNSGIVFFHFILIIWELIIESADRWERYKVVIFKQKRSVWSYIKRNLVPFVYRNKYSFNFIKL